MLQDFIIPNSKTLKRLETALGVTFTNVTYSDRAAVVVSVDPAIAVVLNDVLTVWKTLQPIDKS